MQYHIDRDKVVWRSIDGEVIILNLDTGHYYGLNTTGALIWRLLCQNKNPGEIVEKVVHQYHVSEEKAKEDMSILITMLEKERLLLRKAAACHE